MSQTIAITRAHRSPWLLVIVGGAVMGTLDLLFACGFWGLRNDVPVIRILQSIGAGVLGKASFDGGTASALLGLGCHYFIATMMVWAYYLVSGRIPALVRRPIRHGLLYGLLLYVVMAHVVVPLSNAPQSSKIDPAWMLSSIAIHAVLGVICALYARMARASAAA